MDLFEDILNPVISRILDKRDSLKAIKRFESAGIEGWLRVEIAAALKDKLAALKSRGPMLLMTDNTEVELKAGIDFNPAYFIEGSLKYNCPCIFLGDAGDTKQIARLTSSSGIKIVGYKMFNDGASDWIIGMIQPLSSKK
jgi:hypothetical protein